MESFHLFFGLNLGHRTFSHADNLSTTLPAKKMSACNSKRLVELTIQAIRNMRKEHSFNSFYDTVAKKSTECKFIKDPINPRKRKSPNYSTMHLVDGTTSTRFSPNHMSRSLPSNVLRCVRHSCHFIERPV